MSTGRLIHEMYVEQTKLGMLLYYSSDTWGY